MKNEICPQCGTRNAEWQDEDGHLIVPPLLEPAAIRCYGCAEVERMRESIPENQRGVFVIVKPYQEVPDPDDLEQ